jgi:hypothetical protein
MLRWFQAFLKETRAALDEESKKVQRHPFNLAFDLFNGDDEDDFGQEGDVED